VDEPEDPAAYRYSVPEQIDDGWETASLDSVGLEKDLFVTLVNRLNDLDGDGANSILVARSGKLVFEAYFRESSDDDDEDLWSDRETVHHLQSVTKSITSLLIGIAIDQGLIGGVEEKLFDFFPEYAHLSDEEKAEITLEHLLTMSAGFEWDEGYPYEDPRNDLRRMNNRLNYMAYLLSKPVIIEPGRVFVYNSGLPIALGVIIERVSSLYADEFAEKYLFAPLGIERHHWFRWPDRHPHTGGGLYLTPRALLKIGQLVLNDGEWAGEQVVSSAWIARSTKALQTGRGGVEYGYLWWRGRFSHRSKQTPSIEARGAGGQRLIILPDLDMVIVFTRSNYEQMPRLRSDDIVKSYILPAIRP
jgi:CubicO group peptidase (beta-lactamase class C family)